MSEKKYVVPEGMYNAVIEVLPPHVSVQLSAMMGFPGVQRMLEAALRWLSENPIVPTIEQATEMSDSGHPCVLDGVWYATEWQRRMFLLAPQEDYADRILKNASLGYTPTHAELDKIWEHIFRAGHGWTPPELRKRGDEFGERMNDLTVEVNRVGGVTKAAGILHGSTKPEVPEEIKDLLALGHDPTLRTTVFDYNERILEAYRRGQKGK